MNLRTESRVVASIRQGIRHVIAERGCLGLLEARVKVLELVAAPSTDERLRAELARWLRVAREFLDN